MKTFDQFKHLLTEAPVYLEGNDPAARQLISKTFPDYKGRDVKLEVVEPLYEFSDLISMWDSGYKDEYRLINLQTNEVMKPPVIDGRVAPFKLPPNFALIERSFMGTRQGVTIWLTKDNATPLLNPSPEELTRDEKIVLVATRSLKSVYNGRTRQMESGLSLDAWNAAKETLIAKGLLNRAGAITIKGRNSAVGFRLP